MPTFDFANIVRKILSATLSVALSPIAAVLGVSGVLTSLLIMFNANISLPAHLFERPPHVNFYDSTGLLDTLLYCVNWSLLFSCLTWAFSFLSRVLGYFLTYCSSLFFVLVSVGLFKVVRRKVRDFVS